MARLVVCLFGPFGVTLDEKPVTTFESDKVRALLAYLAVEAGVPHRREKLAGLLWPDWPERAAHANLSRALTNLRQCIGDREVASPVLLTSRQAIQFDRASDAWVDVTEFESRMQEAGERQEDETGVLRLASAVQLCRGPFLDGFSLPGCPEFEEWALFEGERLQRLALRALDRLSTWYEACGELEPALQYTWREVELAPWQERAHQRLMRLLARTGQRGAAIAHYETCRRRLADELGVEPSAETVALYEQIRQAAAVSTPSLVPMHNLRAPLTPFVGREVELAELGERLCDPACRLLTMVGPGGIGKTRLALEAARTHMHRFPDGVFQVRLVGLGSAEAIVPTIAGAIGFCFYRRGEAVSQILCNFASRGRGDRAPTKLHNSRHTARGDAKQQLLDYLSSKTMLLVLDNFEHLLAGVDIVIDLLQAAPGVKVVITSRTRLNLQGEYLFPVDGMEVPPPEVGTALTPLPPLTTGPGLSAARGRGEVKDVAEYDAVKLFTSAARRVCSGFRLGDHAPHVAQICRLMDGIPLAILLAASCLGALSPAEVASRLGHGLDLLEADWRDVSERHRSIRATFDHSWALLPKREQVIFQALAVFRGSFAQEAAQQVTGAALSDLRSLADRSFLHRLPTGRYEVHELLRQYGAEKLEGEPAAWGVAHDRHAETYAAALRRWGEALRGAQQQQALADMDVEIENARAAWDWASERQQVEHLDQALDALCLFYEWRVRYQEGEAACRMAAERLVPAGSESMRLLTRLLIWHGAFYRMLERNDSAAELFRESDCLLEHPALAGQDLQWERAFLLGQRAHLALHSDREKARRLHDQSAALFRAAGDEWWAAAALREEARAVFYQGVHAQARHLLEQSLAIRRALGDQRGMADALDGLGIIATFQGQMEDAERLLRESVAMFRAMGDRFGYAGALGNLGASLGAAGRLEEGHSALEEAIAIYSELSQSWSLAHWMAMLGLVEMWWGRYDEALAQSEIVSTLSWQMSYWRGIGLACLVRGGVALARQAHGQAQQWAQESATLMRKVQQRDDLGYALAVLGAAARGLAQLVEARQHLCEAIQMAAEARSFSIVLFALPVIPSLLADQGQGERAVELYALVTSRIPLVANSPWYEDIAGRHITALAAGLPPNVATVAQARGRARDLWATVAEVAEELAG
jgi:predicted ATPase/DNA-binding SARP family transcriptional activator